MERQVHELKITPQYFKEIDNGIKTFEVRYNDRGFHVGDMLKLYEYADGTYTGRSISAEVTYVLDDRKYCKEGYVVMGIRTMKATGWGRSTERLPEERGQKCLLWMNGKSYLASFVSPEWGFDLDGRQECVQVHPNLWWMPIEAPDGSKE